jgi:long-subunit acyl-CoA synthetase (AMP-forming)
MVIDQPFEIGAGLMTPTLKVRRRAVQSAYSEQIDSLYAHMDPEHA